MMGIGTYGFTVGIPSPLKLGPWDKSGKYYYAPWEQWLIFWVELTQIWNANSTTTNN